MRCIGIEEHAVTTGLDKRSVISIEDLSDDEVLTICTRAQHFAATPRLGASKPLSGCVVGCYFKRTSTRTRTAFSVAALRLGGSVVPYGPHDLQLNTGETFADTGRIFSSMLDVLVARTSDDDRSLQELRAGGRLSVVNAMSASEHPTQALADLSFMLSARGALDHVGLLYIGEGNNSAASLALALSRVPGASAWFLTPPGYGLSAPVVEMATRNAAAHRSTFVEHHAMTELPDHVDFIYTTRWQTTGTEKPDPDWRRVFASFVVDRALVDRYPHAMVMHDLPAHREQEITASVMDLNRFVGFDQAAYKLYSAMGLLEFLLGR
jgi:ornithine carbamoyltransferase